MKQGSRVILLVLVITSVSCIPQGFTTFFTSGACPESWYELGTAKGRLILSVVTPADSGVTVGQPLANRQDPQHSHTYTTEWALPEKDIAADSCCNGQGACQQTYTISGTTASESSGVPFTQLVLCSFNSSNEDPVPFGTVAYFDPTVGSCPSGWTFYTEANGRFLVPGYQQKGVTVSDAPAFDSGQDITHTHSWNSTVDIDDVTYAGIAGCCNTALGESGSFPVKGETDSSSANIPYLQLLTCVNQEDSLEATLPAESVLFNVVGCPGNYSANLAIAGRFLVALPKLGVPGAAFGGDSLPAKYTGPAGTHTHTFQTSFSTTGCEVGLASGCCADGYAKDGSYSISGITAPGFVELPYLTIPACQLIN